MTLPEIPPGVIESIRRALEEDIGPGDITTSLLIPDDDIAMGRFIAKGSFILAGIPFAQEVLRILNPSMKWTPFFADGDKIRKGDTIAEISGKTRTILTGERVSTHPHALGLSFGHWTLDRLVAYAHEQLQLGISRAQLARVLEAEGLRWYQEQVYFSERPDPQFAEKRGRSSHSTKRPRSTRM